MAESGILFILCYLVTTDDVALYAALVDERASLFSNGAADVEGQISPHASSCSCYPASLMLLTLTASAAPNFILIGPGLVWQTLPAGWVDTFESHYSTCLYWHGLLLCP